MTARYGHGVGTGFLDGLLTEDLSDLRRALLDHPLWTGLHTGSTTRAHLRQFALQDAWLIREVHRLDGLAIAKAPDPDAADHLIRKLVPKAGALDLIVDLGVALGLTRADFDRVVPLPGCAGLTTQFYYHLCRSSFVETVACIGASETIFLEICGRIERDLLEVVGLSDEAIRFFAFHDALEPAERATTDLLRRLVPDRATAQAATDAVRLCYQLEALFYDAVLAHPIG
ncbi:MAG: hypothetical protein H6733_14640 [Alphaproteobacteria bacterium]|nr:hypothetical protein [Alphaproteobacteria bacterium]